MKLTHNSPGRLGQKKKNIFIIRLSHLALSVALLFLALVGSGCSSIKPESGYYVMDVDSALRTFRLYVPSSYDASEPLPLVIAMHGLLDSGNGFAKWTRFEDLAEERGFVVAFPDGVLSGWLSVPSNYELSPLMDTSLWRNKVDDVAFISQLIDDISLVLDIDEKRVYACGASNGGMMSYLLALQIPERIAAAASVAATMPRVFVPESDPNETVPFLLIHGTQDPIIPYEGGAVLGLDRLLEMEQDFDLLDLSVLDFLSAEETAAYWALWNQTEPTPLVEMLPDTDRRDATTVNRSTYSNGAGGTEVVLYTVEDGGHTWPGSKLFVPELFLGKTNHDIDATLVIWEFFEKFSKE